MNPTNNTRRGLAIKTAALALLSLSTAGVASSAEPRPTPPPSGRAAAPRAGASNAGNPRAGGPAPRAGAPAPGAARGAASAPAGPGDALVQAAASDPNNIWYGDLRTAMDASKKSGKPMVVYFRSAISPDSDLMEKETLNVAAIKAALREFIPVKVEADKARDVAAAYKIQRVPTIVYLDPEGRELDRFSGRVDMQSFLIKTIEAVDPKTNFVALKERLQANPADLDALYHMGAKYDKRKDYDRATQYYTRVVQLDAENKGGLLDNIQLRKIEEARRKQDYPGAVTLMNEYWRKYPEGDEKELAGLLMARLQWETGHVPEAKAAYEKFLAAFPDSLLAATAEAELDAINGHVSTPPAPRAGAPGPAAAQPEPNVPGGPPVNPPPTRDIATPQVREPR